MKKVSYFISAAVVALGLASCSKEDVVSSDPAQTNRQITIIANTEGSVDTKTSLSGDDKDGYSVLWSEGDKIIVVDGTNKIEFILSEGVGTTRGTFVGEGLEDGTYQAFYGTNGEELSGNYLYEGSNIISSAPMKAEVTITNGAASVANFTNLCGLMRLTLKGNATISEIKVSADQPMNGRMKIDEEDGYAYIPRAFEGNYVNTLDCGEGVDIAAEGTDFYISMPQGDYDGVKIEITDYTGKQCIKTLKTGKKLSIARAQITPVILTVSDLNVKPNVPDGALYGEFTINAEGRKVYFSKGNMYCIAPPLNSTSFGTFLFEENQYNFSKEAYNRDHVSRFCWATDENQSFKDLPTSYFRDGSFFTNNGDFVVNGTWEKYRTLSKDEWEYLFVHHDHRYVTVNGVEGRVIAPDEVKLADNKSTYTPSELKNDNLVFLPFAGRRYGKNYRNDADDNVYGYYWSCTTYDDSYSYGLIIKRDGVESVSMDIDNGCAIRLVTDKK